MLEKEYAVLLNNIIWLRTHYEFSKEKMAEIMGIRVDMINEIESHKMPDDLTVEAILNINKFFRIEPQDLLGKDLSITPK